VKKQIAQAKLYYTYVRLPHTNIDTEESRSGVFSQPVQKRRSSTTIVKPIVVLINAIKRV